MISFENNNNKRSINIDIIKSLALFFVILVHFFLYSGYYSSPYSIDGMKISVIIRIISMSSVPLFIMSSGFLLKNKIPSLSYYSGILKIILTYLVCTFIVSAYFHYPVKDIVFFIKTYIIEISTFKYYAWYVEMYIGLYFIAPIINLTYKNLDKKLRFIMLASLMLISTIPITILNIAMQINKFQFLREIYNFWWLSLYPITYYIIGMLIRDYGKNIKKRYLFPLLIISIAITSYLYLLLGKSGHFETRAHANLGLVLISTLIFLLIINIHISFPPILQKIFIFISKNTLVAYLLSVIIDSIAYKNISILYPNMIDKVKMIWYYSLSNYLKVISIAIAYNLIKYIIIDIYKKISSIFKSQN